MSNEWRETITLDIVKNIAFLEHVFLTMPCVIREWKQDASKEEKNTG